MLRDNKCDQIVALDVRPLSDVTDVVLVATGTSDRQMQSTLDELEDLAAESGRTAFRTSKDDRSTWLLADFVDVVVHLFEPGTRAYYDIEMLWGDAKRITWRRPRGGEASAAEDQREDQREDQLRGRIEGQAEGQAEGQD